MKRWIKISLAAALVWAVFGQAAVAHVPAHPQNSPLFVTTTADTGAGSFRRAIGMAQQPGPDSILFAIPASDPGYNASRGTWTIRPTGGFWVITDGDLVIDGRSQAQFFGGDPNANGPEIEISGENLPSISILTVAAPNVEIRGLTLNRSKAAAILFQGVKGGRVLGCYLGTNSDGDSAAGNGYGVEILMKSRDIVIGRSSDPAEGNLISGNQDGIFLWDSCMNVSIIGNRVGTNRTGTDTIGNVTTGVSLQEWCDSSRIFDNIIGGSPYGISLSRSHYSHIANNAIGTDVTWTHNLANSISGIYLNFFSTDNLVSSNCIGYSQRAGIQNFGAGSVRNRLTQNRISRNEERGIENGFGANYGLAPPTILSVTATSVSGTAGVNQVVEVFTDDSTQGIDYLGSAMATGGGTFSVPLAAPVGRRYVTATATDSAGNTSEFSVAFLVNVVNVRTSAATPVEFGLSQNYPNPFNPTTEIRYAIGVRQLTTVKVYDLLGREVVTLVNEVKQPGTYTVKFDGSRLASGVYVYRLTSGTRTDARKMICVK
jgi:parallel beta-helix repeat protein